VTSVIDPGGRWRRRTTANDRDESNTSRRRGAIHPSPICPKGHRKLTKGGRATRGRAVQLISSLTLPMSTPAHRRPSSMMHHPRGSLETEKEERERERERGEGRIGDKFGGCLKLSRVSSAKERLYDGCKAAEKRRALILSSARSASLTCYSRLPSLCAHS
jgi:hypothetical protein